MLYILEMSIVYKSDRIEKKLFELSNVRLLRVPAPLDNELSVENWDFNDVFWVGEMNFIQTEYYSSSGGGSGSIVGRINFVNKYRETVLSVEYEDNVLVTNRKDVFRIVIRHEMGLIGLGLKLKSIDDGIAVNFALQEFKKDLVEGFKELQIAGDDGGDVDMDGNGDGNGNDNGNEFGEFISA